MGNLELRFQDLPGDITDDILKLLPSKAILVSKRYKYLEPDIIKEPYVRDLIMSCSVPLLDNALQESNTKLLQLLLSTDIVTYSVVDIFSITDEVEKGNISTLKVYMNSKYNSIYESITDTIFDEAIEHGKIDIVDTMIFEYNYQISTTSLKTCIHYKQLTIFEYLYPKITVSNKNYGSLIYRAAISGSRILSYLLSQDHNRLQYIEYNHNIIIDTCVGGYIDNVKELLKYPMFDPSVVYNSCIYHAFDKKHYDLFRLLLADPRVDPSVALCSPNSTIKHSSLLTIAAARSKHDIVELLLKDGRCDPNIDPDTIDWLIKDKQDDILCKYVLERANAENKERIRKHLLTRN
jgi:hypothetical protein